MLRSLARTALLALPILFAACDSTEDECDDGRCLPPPAVVLVGNQGNFSDGDGSVTVYAPNTDTADERIADLGTIVQSLAVDEANLYVAANSAGRVDVFAIGPDGEIDAERSAQIEVVNPRYLAFGGGKIYVASQRYNEPSRVAVVDGGTFEVIETVEVGGFAEDVVVAGGRVFVATGAFGATQEVVVLDAATDEVVQRIDVGCASPRELAVDADGEVWVFCAGAAATDTAPAVDGEVVILDAATGDVAERIAVDGRLDTAGPGQTAYAYPTTNQVFAVLDQRAVLRFDGDANALTATIDAAGGPIGAVAYDGIANRLYLGRVPGFTTAGTVTIHEADGTQVGVFTAGVAPTSILFR